MKKIILSVFLSILSINANAGLYKFEGVKMHLKDNYYNEKMEVLFLNEDFKTCIISKELMVCKKTDGEIVEIKDKLIASDYSSDKKCFYNKTLDKGEKLKDLTCIDSSDSKDKNVVIVREKENDKN